MKNFTSFICLSLFLLIGYNIKSQTLLWEPKLNYDTEENPFFEGIDTVPSGDLGNWNVVEQLHDLDGEEEEISVELPTGDNFTFERDYSDIDTFDVVTWFGINSDNINYPNSVAHFTMHQDSLLGYITLNDSVAYKILPIGNNHFVCFEREYNKQCDSDLMPKYKDEDLRLSGLYLPFPLLICNGLNIYRMIIAYTPEFANTFSTTNRQQLINEFVKSVVDSTNQTYIRSNTNVRVRLALSYQTASEFGSLDSDSPSFAKKGYNFLWSSRSNKYDEIFDLRNQYHADAAILLVSYNGGRAHRRSQTAVYGKDGSADLYGVAHEVGHMFDLEHNRDEFTWFEQRFLDPKKAYGYRGWVGGKRSVMSYGDLQTRVHVYSDPGYQFPGSSQSAGNSKSKARNYLQSHLGNLFIFNDYIDWYETGRTIYYNQMTSQFAYNRITLHNYVFQGGSEANIRAGNEIELLAGTTVNNGADVVFEIKACENTQVFRKKFNNNLEESNLGNDGSLTIYPNPTNSFIKVYLKMDSEEFYQLYLFDSLGKLKINLSGSTSLIEKSLDLRDFSQGVYYLKVVINNQVFQSKIVKTN